MEQVDGAAYALGREFGALVLSAIVAVVTYGLRRLVNRRSAASRSRRWASSFVVGFTLALVGGLGAAGTAVAEGREVQAGLLVPALGLVAAFFWWIAALRKDPGASTPARPGVGGTPH